MSINIGITMRVVNAASYNEPRDAISHDWLKFLFSNNLNFTLIPNCGDNVEKFLSMNNINFIILTNGNDVNDVNNQDKLNNVSSIRDNTENNIITWAINNNKSILAVCRGFQLINMYYGGTINYNLGDTHIAKNHRIEICDDISRSYFKKDSFLSNSYHNNGVKNENLADNLIPFAMTEDKFVEGFYVRDKQILAIQWHPERKLKNHTFYNLMAVNFINKGPWWL